MMEPNYDQTIKRTRAYWYIDGLAEMTTGALFLLFGLVYLLLSILPHSSPFGIAIRLIYPLFLLLAMWSGGKLVKNIKVRLTYPRTGFVAYRRPSRKRRMVTFGVGVLVTLGLITLMSWLEIEALTWFPFLDGAFLGLILLVISPGLPRFYMLAGISLLMGTLFTYLGIGGEMGHGAFFGCIGLILLVCGAITLRGYLRQAPPPEEAIIEE